MKKLISLITLNVLLSVSLYAQDNSSNNDQTTTTESNERESLNEIKKGIAELREIIEKNNADSLLKVGFLRLKHSNDVPVEKKIGEQREQTKVKIEKITLVVKDGYMNDVQVFAKTNDNLYLKFTNTRSPIGITSKRLDKGDNLTHQSNTNLRYTLNTNSFWDYESFGSYTPQDGIYIIDLKNQQGSNNSGITFYKESGINSILDIRFYTDVLATFGRESSGLAQTDVSFRQILHRSNIWNSGTFLPLQYIKFNLSLKKFDSQFSSTTISDFNRNLYLQRSWLTSDISTSFTSFWIEKKSPHSFYTDIGATINLSDIEEENNTKTTSSYGLFIEPGLDLRIADNFTINVINRFLWHFSPETDFDNQDKRTPFMISGLDLSWNPLGDNAGRIFGRISYVSNLNGENNNFYHFQTGYKLRLTDLTKSS